MHYDVIGDPSIKPEPDNWDRLTTKTNEYFRTLKENNGKPAP